MKVIISVILVLLSLSVTADSEVGASYKRVNQNLFGTIEFPMDAASIDYTYWHDSGLGFRIAGGKSTETANALYVVNKRYSSTILHMWEFLTLYKVKLNKWEPYIGVGQTNYRTDWTVNGEVPAWSGGSDSDWSYHIGTYYQIEPNVYIDLSYADWYRKDKEGYGRETTRGFQLRLSYRF